MEEQKIEEKIVKVEVDLAKLGNLKYNRRLRKMVRIFERQRREKKLKDRGREEKRRSKVI